MKKLIVPVLFALSLGACSKSDDVVGKMKDLKERMCACKDQKCVDDVKKDYKAFDEEMDKKYKDSKPDPDTLKAAGELESQMEDCQMKIETGAK